MKPILKALMNASESFANDIPSESLEQMKREGWATIQEQEQYWIDKEAQSNNVTNETGGVDWKALAISRYELMTERWHALWDIKRWTEAMTDGELALAMSHLDNINQIVTKTLGLSHGNQSTTADPKPKDDLSRTESLCDWIDHDQDDEVTPYRLRDEGRNPDGTGESYAERNV